MRTINFLGEYRNLISNSNNHLILQLIDEDVTEARPQPVAGSFNVSDYTKQALFSVPITIDKTNLVDINFNSNPLNTLGEGVYFFNVTDEGGANYPNDTFSTFSILEKGAKKSMFSLVTLKDILSSVDSKFKNYSATIAKGDKGDRGEQGIQGMQGVQGIQGERGIQGADGQKGDKGERGPQGFQGQDGIKGEKGDRGEKGDTGDKGDKGDTGKNFNIAKTFSSVDYMNTYTGTEVSDGDFVLISTTDVNNDDNGKLFVKAGDKFNLLAVIRGVQGIKGDKGDPGEKGERGYKGDTGLQGPQGLTGAQGPKGDQGIPGKDSDVGLAKDNVFTGNNTFNQPITGRLIIDMAPQKNLDDLGYTARYKIDSSYTSVPVNMPNGAFIDVMNFDNNLIYQVITSRQPTATTTKSTQWVRIKMSNVWGPWQSISKDDDVVHKTGDENVGGNKKFDNAIKVGDSSYGKGSLELVSDIPYIDFHYGSDKTQDYTSRIIEDANGQLSFVNASGVQTIKTNIDGNSASTNKLKIAKNIAGVPFDGTQDINLPGVNIKGNQDTTGTSSATLKTQVQKLPAGSTIDDIKKAGVYMDTDGDLNGLPIYPVWGVLEVFERGDSDVIQRFNVTAGTDDFYICQRNFASGQWKLWKKI